MLELLVHILLISGICILWGAPLLVLLRRNPDLALKWAGTGIRKWAFCYFAGLLVLSALSSWYCLFFPLQSLSLACFSVIPLLFLYRHHYFSRERINNFIRSAGRTGNQWLTVLIISLVALILVLGTMPPQNQDTGIYHLQIIRWTREYGVVPGLANLFPRYGLGSNWFNLIAWFELPGRTLTGTSALNGATACWFLSWLGSFCFDTRHEEKGGIQGAFRFMSAGMLFFCLLEWELLRDAVNSTNYDFIVMVLTWIPVLVLLKAILDGERLAALVSPPLIIAWASLPGMKLSGILAGAILFLLLILSKQRSHWYWLAGAGLVLVAPVLLRNYLASGYPLYPIPLALGHPDWQLPGSMTRYLQQYIIVSNRFYNHPIDYTRLPELMNAPWTGTWIKGITWIQKTVIGLALTSPLALWHPLVRTKCRNNLGLLILVLWIMTFGWFLSAPSPRFGYGALLPLAILFPSLAILWLPRRFHLLKVLPFVPVLILAYTVYKGTSLQNNSRIWLSAENPTQPTGKQVNLNGSFYFLPEIQEGRWMRDCFAAPLPCISQQNPYLEKRGSSLSDGFRMNQDPDSQFVRRYIY